jgi:hypothetical protein
MHLLAIFLILYFLLRYLDQAKRARGGAAACAALVNAIEAQQARTEARLDSLELWRKQREEEREVG